jgi:hypothetical protein
MIRPMLAAAVLLASLPAMANGLRSFSADYDVLIDGKAQGRSRMSLVEESPGAWLHTVEAKGTGGLARLAGFAALQTTRFAVVDGRPQLRSATSSSETLIRRREVRTEFDWDAGLARWEGDLKDHQRAPTALSADAVNAPLLNLLLALDSRSATPGTQLHYRLFERGSADPVDYTVGPAERVSVPAGDFDAVLVRGERPQKKRVLSAWYADTPAPTPVRMLQVEEGKPTYELRLAAVQL